jgi:hypothetical protein
LLLKNASHRRLMGSIVIQKEMGLQIALPVQMSSQFGEVLGYLLGLGLLTSLEKTLAAEKLYG